jgi:phenylacetic acid degradation operon negative regulatory protein
MAGRGAGDAPGALRPCEQASAKVLALTLLSELVLPNGGAVWTSTLVRGLDLLHVEERNARMAVTRLAERGLLRAEREGRRARWHLTDEGRALLGSGAERVHRFAAASEGWDGRWLLVVCSVPERHRPKRYQLRAHLRFAGFGFLDAGIAISPHVDREALVVDLLAELGLSDEAVVVRAEAGKLTADEDLLERAWDLGDLAMRYRTFNEAFRRRVPTTGAACLVGLVELVWAWSRFPFVDPELPSQLLPARWPGRAAERLFHERYALWRPAAVGWYLQAEAEASSRVRAGSG